MKKVSTTAIGAFVLGAIVLLVASKLFFVGVLLAIWAGATQIVMPLAKGIGFLLTSPQLQRRRVRAVLTSTLAVGLVVGLVFFLPVPLWTRTEGVVWLPEQSHVRAGTDGFVVRLLAPDGTTVRRDEPLIETADPLLPTRVRLLEEPLTMICTHCWQYADVRPVKDIQVPATCPECGYKEMGILPFTEEGVLRTVMRNQGRGGKGDYARASAS